MSDIFISYKAEDRARIAPLVKALEDQGLSVWWDQHIGGGANWRDEIERHLDAARCVIVAWSKRTLGPEGRFVRDEAARAQAAGKYLPIAIDKVRLPLGFGETQAIDFARWKGKADDPRFLALVTAARAIVAGEQHVIPAAVHGGGEISRRAVIGGGAAAILALAGGGYALFRSGKAEAKRIAILPFASLTGGQPDYFADGLAEELRGALSRAGLEVIGRTSSEAVADAKTEEIVRELHVGHILTGSVRRSGESMRVSAQLIEGRDGVETWAENYDRAAGDAIKIQTDIAERVASALSVAMGVIRKAVEEGGTRDPVAQDLVLQGSELLREKGLTKETLPQVIAFNRQAIRRDPKYVRAILSLGQLQASYAGQFAASPEEGRQWLADAERTIRHGVALAPDFAPGYAALADLDRGRLRYGPALAGFRKAVQLAPTSTNALTRALNALPWIGTLEEAEKAARTVVSLDPLNPTVHSLLTLALSLAGRLDEAIAAGRKAVALSPDNANALTQLAYVQVQKGDYDAALKTSSGLGEGDFNIPFVAGAVAARRGDTAGMDKALATLNGMFGEYAAFQYAQLHALAGQKDKAFEQLAVAQKVQDPGLMSTMRDPFLKSLHGDPRFAAVVKAMNFPVVDPGIA